MPTNRNEKYVPVNRAVVVNTNYKPVNRASLLPPKKATLGSKVLGVGKELVKGIVSPVATMVARPVQLGAQLLGVSDDSVNKFTKEKFGDWVAPTPQNRSDVIKDVGRGIQTVALGLPTTNITKSLVGTVTPAVAALGSKSIIPTANFTGKVLGLAGEGAAFGYGAGLEKSGEPFGKETLKSTAIGATIGGAIPFAGKGFSKLTGKAKNTTKGAEKVAIKETPIITKATQEAEIFASKTKNVDELISYEGAPDAKQVAIYKNKIRAGEKLDPIKIMRDNEGKFGIEDGKHRYEAYKQLGFKDVPVEEVFPRTEAGRIASGQSKTPKLTEKQYQKYDNFFEEGIDKTYKKSTIDTWNIKSKDLLSKNKLDDVLDTMFTDNSKVAWPEGLPKEAVRKYLQQSPEKLTTRQKSRISNKVVSSEAGAELRATQLFTSDAFEKVGQVNKKLQKDLKNKRTTKESIINFLNDNICPI